MREQQVRAKTYLSPRFKGNLSVLPLLSLSGFFLSGFFFISFIIVFLPFFLACIHLLFSCGIWGGEQRVRVCIGGPGIFLGPVRR
jgi:hypothetical protein